jgi:protein yorkie
MSTQSDSMEQQKGSNHQILRINPSSGHELDELFNAVIGPKDSQIPLSVPMRQRKLPPSFFVPPDGSHSASHSRESSLDASQPSSSPLSPSSPQQTLQQAIGVNVVNGLTINHPRAHSSPATLQQTFAVNTCIGSASQQTQHIRQLSYDIDHLQLPIGWEMAKTPNGERYFINHTEKTTTWEDPRKKVLEQQLQQQLQQQTQPRLVVVSANNNSNANTNNSSNSNNSSNNNLSSGALPEGWEQSRTPSGEIYYINHVERITSWFDPRLPLSAQQQSKAQSRNGRTPPPPFTATVPSSLVVALQNMNTSGNNSNIDAIRLQQQQQQQLRVQRSVLNLQQEREQLRQRREEILLRQNYMLKHSSVGEDNSPSNRLPPISSTGIDPFLGGTNGPLNNDCHSRQESADSGLGLGPNYSLPHTPEDFLNNIDDAVNSGDDTNNNLSRNSNNDLGLDTLQVPNLDLGTENMESDDLVPSLPDDFNADLLSNVEALLDTNRDNIMTWL